MPITFTIDEDKGYYTARFEGVVTDSELTSAFEEFHAAHDVFGMNDFTDLSDVELREITTDGIRRFAQQVKHRFSNAAVQGKRSAIYAPTDLTYGLARMHLAGVEGLPYSLRIFRDRGAALAWLEESNG